MREGQKCTREAAATIDFFFLWSLSDGPKNILLALLLLLPRLSVQQVSSGWLLPGQIEGGHKAPQKSIDGDGWRRSGFPVRNSSTSVSPYIKKLAFLSFVW